MKQKIKIAIALSGGIDSFVSGFLLKQKFDNVFGIHFKTGYENKEPDLKKIENQLGFKVFIVDLSKEFDEKIIKYFTTTYIQGKTPNPCIICNKEIKFKALMLAAQKLKADYLATGHYATVINKISFPDKNINRAWLEKGKDSLKDQSYFLSLLSSKQLEKIIFPLSDMNKNQVIEFAKKNNLTALSKKESQDICFVENNDFASFVDKKLLIKHEKGKIIDNKGKPIGYHNGLYKFTIGQRKGINCPSQKPYYVKQIDIKNNILRVCFKNELTNHTLKLDNINWNYEKPKKDIRVMAKIRYQHKEAKAVLSFDSYSDKKKRGVLVFDKPQYAITPGQIAAFYKEERVLGAGIIV